ncbi:glycosyltransferase [Sphingobacterium sp. WM]|uniref:glycosyltransferase n=1 Tax=Sphingobacterium sp. WM TaxID=3031802 RepID=UPI00240E8E8D|nr:glycosyltransferase [Sphingobacterium sp. WM]WFB63280.1 glycosyltransferase [Sphingobacterium sp. WM]
MKKKALQVVNIPFVLPYYFGDQILFLKQNEIEISIACSPGPELNNFCSKYNIAGYPVDILRKIDLLTDILSLFKLIKIIKKEKFDYVIGHTPKGALLSMLAAKITGVKNRIYFRHGIVYETSFGLKRSLMVCLEKVTSWCSTKIISVSNSVQKYSEKERINSIDKSIVLNKGTCNGVNLDRFDKSVPTDINFDLSLEGSFVVGYVGRLVNDKGIKELIEAWDLVKNKIPKSKLLLVGPYEERDSLPDMIKDKIINDISIIHTDLVNDTVPFYKEMDVFILPSYREGFPTVVLEASAMELPVITTKSTGCIDSIIENETGVYANINALSISEKILYYFNNPAVRSFHGRNGRKWVKENFDQNIVWQFILKDIFN